MVRGVKLPLSFFEYPMRSQPEKIRRSIPKSCIRLIGSSNMNMPKTHGRRSPADPAIEERTIAPLLSASRPKKRFEPRATAPIADMASAFRLTPEKPPANSRRTRAIPPDKRYL